MKMQNIAFLGLFAQVLVLLYMMLAVGGNLPAVRWALAATFLVGGVSIAAGFLVVVSGRLEKYLSPISVFSLALVPQTIISFVVLWKFDL